MGLTAKSQLCSSGSTLSGDSLQACSLLRWSSALGHDAVEAMLGPLCKQPDNKQYISDDKAHHPMAMREGLHRSQRRGGIFRPLRLASHGY